MWKPINTLGDKWIIKTQTTSTFTITVFWDVTVSSLVGTPHSVTFETATMFVFRENLNYNIHNHTHCQQNIFRNAHYALQRRQMKAKINLILEGKLIRDLGIFGCDTLSMDGWFSWVRRNVVSCRCQVAKEE